MILTSPPQGKKSRSWQMMPGVLNILLLMFLSLCLPLPIHAQLNRLPGSADAGAEVSLVRLDDGLLSVRVYDLPLRVILMEIGRLSAIEMVVDRAITERVSVQFENVPVDEGLKRLVTHSDAAGYMLLYDPPVSPQHAPGQPKLKRAVVLAKVRETRKVREDTGHSDAHVARQSAVRATRARTLTALGSRPEMQEFLDVWLHQRDPVKKYSAFEQLTTLLSNDELQTLIDLLEDTGFRAQDWEVALRPLQNVATPDEVKVVIAVLNNSTARETAANFFRQLIEDRNPEPGS
jgi:hypothetical protein